MSQSDPIKRRLLKYKQIFLLSLGVQRSGGNSESSQSSRVERLARDRRMRKSESGSRPIRRSNQSHRCRSAGLGLPAGSGEHRLERNSAQKYRFRFRLCHLHRPRHEDVSKFET